jgi:hypothetical protein
MEWCLFGLALLVGLLALAVLLARPSRLALPQVSPGALLRGCLAAPLLLVAALLAGGALLAAGWRP